MERRLSGKAEQGVVVHTRTSVHGVQHYLKHVKLCAFSFVLQINYYVRYGTHVAVCI